MIRGMKRAIKKEAVPQVHAEAKFSIHNRFDIEVIDATSGEVKQKAYAENIVLDALWTRLLAPNTYFNYIHYGTGTGTLAASRTSLFTFLGAKAAASKVLTYSWANGWISSRKQCQIAETEYVGSELKEVGIGYSATSTNLVTHALLKDMNGNTITIVKTATDLINIYATVFLYFNAAGYDNASIKVSTFETNLFFKLYLLGDYNSKYHPKHLVAFKGNPLPLEMVDSDINPIDTESGPEAKALTLLYNASTKKIYIAATRLDTTKANQNGIRCISLMSGNSNFKYPCINFYVGGSWQPKTSITAESIGTGDGSNKLFKTAFGFLKAGAKIYADGVEQTSGITLRTGLPYEKNKMAQYFEQLETSIKGDTEVTIATGSTTGATSAGSYSYSIYYNPFYTYGILSFKSQYVTVEVSDDLLAWTTLVDMNTTGLTTTTVAAGSRQKKYWKITTTKQSYSSAVKCYEFIADTLPNNNIEFDTAPASGAVITADYDCEVIAKDANHVFDFSFEITLGEKTT